MIRMEKNPVNSSTVFLYFSRLIKMTDKRRLIYSIIQFCNKELQVGKQAILYLMSSQN